jgi:lipoic acid synthetase
MAQFKGIPILSAGDASPGEVAGEPARSGEKYRTAAGLHRHQGRYQGGREAASGPAARKPGARKPTWLRAPLASGAGFQAVKHIVREHRLSTVCEEAKCPNIGECWNAGTATIMLMGAVCTRACRFCAVDTGNPQGWLDPEEPENVARSVELMGLHYVVLTSVDRDDLPDGGAAHYAAAIRAIKSRTPHTAVEALTPDFAGVLADVYTVMDSGLDVFAQNVETVERLTHPVRDPRAGYRRTLDVLAAAKAYRPAVLTKTSLMLGLGETDAEIRETMRDLRAVGGRHPHPGPVSAADAQPPRRRALREPEEFAEYRSWALDLGFLECVSGPLVRSSYRAEQALARNNAGLDQGLARRRAAARTPLERCAAHSSPRARALRAHVARDAALHGRARRRHSRRDLAARASAGLYPGAQRETRAPPRAGRHSGDPDRSRRASHLSRTGSARGLSAHRSEAPGPWACGSW